ncbi:MAG TPA: SHOCT domain-containing protein [Xanthobacteraceae bacterium]
MTMLEPIIIVGIVIAITAWYVQHKWRRRVRAMAAMRERDTAILDVLARRYASGEIDRDEYLQKRSDILSFSGIPQNRV